MEQLFTINQQQEIFEKETPFLIRGTEQRLAISISIGVGHTEDSYYDLKDLFQLADTALYEAKIKRGCIIAKCN